MSDWKYYLVTRVETQEQIVARVENAAELVPEAPFDYAIREIESAQKEIMWLKSRLSDLENGRPMDTAPRDGTQLLAEVRDQFGRSFDIVEWDAGVSQWIGNLCDYLDVYKRTEYRDDYLVSWWPLPGSNTK